MRWDLTPVEPVGGLDGALAAVLERCRAFRARHEGRVSTLDANALGSVLDELDELWDELSRLGAYATLRSSENVLGEEEQDLSARAELALVRAEDELQFVDDEWLAVPDERARSLLHEEQLAPYRHLLEAKRRFRPHLLSPPEEQALASRDAAAEHAWVGLYDRILASLRIPFQGRELTLSELLGHLRGRDGGTRAAALLTVASGLEPVLPTLAHCYDALVADRIAVDDLRGFAGPRAATDLENELPSPLVDRMLDAAEEQFELGRAWYRRKARLLGGPLSGADEHAPLDAEPSVSFDEAVTTIAAGLGRVAPELGELARDLVEDGRVDAEPRPGKTGSSFCMSVSREERPYVLLNYRGRLSDALKLAHELGHAVHFALAAGAQPVLSMSPPVPTAEVASSFAQLAVLDELVQRARDARARTALLAAGLEGSLDAVLRQVALTRFEEEAYRLRAAGQPLTESRLSALWLDVFRRYFGSTLAIEEAYGASWACIGQLFRTRFYNCGYVFAYLTSLALRRLAAEQPGFGARYVAFLRRGGDDEPLTQLADLGLDPRRGGVWELAFSELRSQLAAVGGER